MLAYSKIVLYAALLDSDLPEDPALDGELDRYFPSPLPERFGDEIARRHRLRREIVATRVTNDLSTARARRSCSACARTPARRWPTSRAPRWSRATCSTCARCGPTSRRSTAQVAGRDQYDMLLASRRMVERSTRWLLRSRPRPLDIAAERERYGEGARAVAGAAARACSSSHEQEAWRERVGAAHRGRRAGGAGRPRGGAGRALLGARHRRRRGAPPSGRSRRSPRCTS